MADPILFFSRCKPQEADPIEIVRRERRVFIGWPAWRPDRPFRRGRLRDSIVDVTCPWPEWQDEMARQNPQHRRHFNQNRNFVAKVVPGSIALVPRPNLGVVFAGRVQGNFELLDDPPWGDDYMALREAQGRTVEDVPGYSHTGDVAQCWQVDTFRPIPIPAVPAWIRRSLFGRSTYGEVRSPGMGLDAFKEMDRLIDQQGRIVRPWSRERAEVERRLLADVGPSSFEHLCVALLQLEHPDEVWAHVGGSGDGGVDGIGAGADGGVSSLLQCKWAYYGESLDFSTPWGRPERDERRRILASLIHPSGGPKQDEIAFWSRERVAELVIKHADRLPAALAMRIGTTPYASKSAT